ncbi:MAG: hypothetical protein AAGJ70_01555 [Pseudomonadota bacterium]
MMRTLATRSKSVVAAIAAVAALFATPMTSASAGEAEIVSAQAKRAADGTYAFSVTLKHGDTGWDHYANAWDVVDAKGTVLGKRTLHHPHVDEQPFTRSLSSVTVPEGLTTVTIRAYDSVHGQSKATLDVALPGRTASNGEEKSEAAAESDATAKPVAKVKKPAKLRKKVARKKVVRKKRLRKRTVRRKAAVKRNLRKRTVKRKVRKVRKATRKVRRGSY